MEVSIASVLHVLSACPLTKQGALGEQGQKWQISSSQTISPICLLCSIKETRKLGTNKSEIIMSICMLNMQLHEQLIPNIPFIAPTPG